MEFQGDLFLSTVIFAINCSGNVAMWQCEVTRREPPCLIVKGIQSVWEKRLQFAGPIKLRLLRALSFGETNGERVVSASASFFLLPRDVTEFRAVMRQYR